MPSSISCILCGCKVKLAVYLWVYDPHLWSQTLNDDQINKITDTGIENRFSTQGSRAFS